MTEFKLTILLSNVLLHVITVSFKQQQSENETTTVFQRECFPYNTGIRK